MVDTFKEIKNWFELAIPEPTEDNKRVQLGVHLEEVCEMLETIVVDNEWPTDVKDVYVNLTLVANNLKKNKEITIDTYDRKEFLDSLCDQVVTAIGVGHMYGFDILGALAEVSASNSSKFVDGKPIFNEHEKISKGKNYFKPDLAKFV